MKKPKFWSVMYWFGVILIWVGFFTIDPLISGVGMVIMLVSSGFKRLENKYGESYIRW